MAVAVNWICLLSMFGIIISVLIKVFFSTIQTSSVRAPLQTVRPTSAPAVARKAPLSKKETPGVSVAPYFHRDSPMARAAAGR